MNQLDWDIQTITPGDYTLQYEITDEAYHWFLNNVYLPGNFEARGVSIALCLKEHMKSELEKTLTEKLREIKASGADTSNIKISEVKIADIVFAFNNAELIKLLRERGSHIMYQRFDAMRRVEQQISTLKDEKFKELVKPVDAFITFEEEDGNIIGQEFEAQYTFTGKRLPAKTTFLGQELFLSESTEPTNIIWENRHWTPRDYIRRSLLVFGIIFVLVLISFGLIFLCKSYSLEVKKKYPVVECPTIKESYGLDLEKYALREYEEFYNYESKGYNNPGPLSGALQCYCDSKADGVKGSEMMNEKIGDVKVCEQYVMDFYLSLVTNSAVQYMIIAINYILRVFIIKLIIYIGKDTESEQTRLITNGVFIVQFFNTALLLLLVNANFDEQSGFLSFFFKGAVGDFNSWWFSDIGNTLIGAMMFNIYWPVMEFFVWFGYRTLFR